MKVLFVTSSGAPNGMYGGSVALYNLAMGLRKNVEMEFVFPNKGVLEQSLREQGFKCYVIPRYDLKWYPGYKSVRQCFEFIPRLARMLYKRTRAIKNLGIIVKKTRPDIIHTNVGPLDIGHIVALKYNIPHVWHIREYQTLDFNAKPFPSMSNFRKKISNSNNHLIAITKDIFSWFKMDAAKDGVIYDGVFEKKEKCDFDKEKEYYLFVGSMSEAKGVLSLLHGYRLYILNGGRYPLKIVGAGGSKSYYENCLKFIENNGIADFVEFCGFRRDVYEIMGRAKALIVTSRFEGFGFITAEAMYNGCLVAGFNTGGTKEQFDNGLCIRKTEIGFRFSSVTEIADILLRIDQNDSNVLEMRKNAFDVVNKLYSLESSAKKIYDFYKKLKSLDLISKE